MSASELLDRSAVVSEDPEQAACELLRSGWGSDLRTCKLPIEPFAIAETLGLKVQRIALEPDVSGMLAKRPGEDPQVYVNAADSNVRQRFSCAHEIGHYIKRTTGPKGAGDTKDDEWGYIDRRGPSASRGTSPDEIYANRFAAALLMPGERIEVLTAEGLGPVAMAAQFDVSLDAMTFRLDNLAKAKLAAQ
jgi:Zn-dependent peptidase ImmA (M78 family)